MTNLWLNIFISIVGMGYFNFGKRREQPIFLISGIILTVYSYFVGSLAITCLIAAILIIGPFFLQKYI